MNWFSQHIPHILGGLGIGGAGGAIVFRDAIGKMWDAFLADRAAARSERIAAAAKPDPLKDVIELMRGELKAQRELLSADIDAQRANDGTLRTILDRMTSAVEKMAERQDQFNRKQDQQDQRIERWERSRGIN